MAIPEPTGVSGDTNVSEAQTSNEAPKAADYEFGVGKSIAFSLLLLTLFFGCGEGAVRTWAYFFRADYEKFDLATQTFVLVPGDHGDGVRINSQGFVGRELEPDGEDLWRVVALGDSCTWGGGGSDDTYPALLQARLRDTFAENWRYEVVNAGVQGLNSTLALRRLRSKVLPLDPDVVTIYLGWNDLMKFDPSSQSHDDRWSGVARMLDRLWLVKGMRKLAFYYVRPRLHPPATGPESRTGRFGEFEPTVYEENLRELVATVREAGARPVLLTLPTIVRPDMTVRDLRENQVMFPYFPSAYGVGDLLDLLAAYNRSVRRVGTESNVPVLDLARDFDALPDVRPLFYDTMHPDYAGRQRVAAKLYDLMVRERLLPVGAPGQRFSRRSVRTQRRP